MAHPTDLDSRFRAAALAYVDQILDANGGLITREQAEAFMFEGQRVPLMERQRGIRKVRWLEGAISILTTYVSDPAKAPYEDTIGDDQYFRYKWQGKDPDSWDNKSLRYAMDHGLQLIWFEGVQPSIYQASFVWLVHEEPEQHQFVVALDAIERDMWRKEAWEVADKALRQEYAQRLVRDRLHQSGFRKRVLAAYRNQCALCRLQHVPLLDAAHIKEDSEGGPPTVPNGIAMCAIHHRAFDASVLGIRPDYVIQIQPHVLVEKDGPTLRHALQELHGSKIHVPRQVAARPNPELLAERFDRFRAAS